MNPDFINFCEFCEKEIAKEDQDYYDHYEMCRNCFKERCSETFFFDFGCFLTLFEKKQSKHPISKGIRITFCRDGDLPRLYVDSHYVSLDRLIKQQDAKADQGFLFSNIQNVYERHYRFIIEELIGNSVKTLKEKYDLNEAIIPDSLLEDHLNGIYEGLRMKGIIQ